MNEHFEVPKSITMADELVAYRDARLGRTREAGKPPEWTPTPEEILAFKAVRRLREDHGEGPPPSIALGDEVLRLARAGGRYGLRDAASVTADVE